MYREKKVQVEDNYEERMRDTSRKGMSESNGRQKLKTNRVVIESRNGNVKRKQNNVSVVDVQGNLSNFEQEDNLTPDATTKFRQSDDLFITQLNVDQENTHDAMRNIKSGDVMDYIKDGITISTPTVGPINDSFTGDLAGPDVIEGDIKMCRSDIESSPRSGPHVSLLYT